MKHTHTRTHTRTHTLSLSLVRVLNLLLIIWPHFFQSAFSKKIWQPEKKIVLLSTNFILVFIDQTIWLSMQQWSNSHNKSFESKQSRYTAKQMNLTKVKSLVDLIRFRKLFFFGGGTILSSTSSPFLWDFSVWGTAFLDWVALPRPVYWLNCRHTYFKYRCEQFYV